MGEFARPSGLATGTRSPRRYALDPGTQLSDSWTQSQLNGTKYWIALHGANGFLRIFRGDLARKPGRKGAEPEIEVSYDMANNAVCLNMRNSGRGGCIFTVRSNAYRTQTSRLTVAVPAGGIVVNSWPVAASGNWYDFSVTVDTEPAFLRRFAGRLENGQDLVSDPAAA